MRVALNFWGKFWILGKNLENLGHHWSEFLVVWPYKAGSKIQPCVYREFEPEREHEEPEDRPCPEFVLSPVIIGDHFPFHVNKDHPLLTVLTAQRQEIRRQECRSEAKKTWPWRFGTMMQEMNGIDGDGDGDGDVAVESD